MFLSSKKQFISNQDELQNQELAEYSDYSHNNGSLSIDNFNNKIKEQSRNKLHTKYQHFFQDSALGGNLTEQIITSPLKKYHSPQQIIPSTEQRYVPQQEFPKGQEDQLIRRGNKDERIVVRNQIDNLQQHQQQLISNVYEISLHSMNTFGEDNNYKKGDLPGGLQRITEILEENYNQDTQLTDLLPNKPNTMPKRDTPSKNKNVGFIQNNNNHNNHNINNNDNLPHHNNNNNAYNHNNNNNNNINYKNNDNNQQNNDKENEKNHLFLLNGYGFNEKRVKDRAQSSWSQEKNSTSSKKQRSSSNYKNNQSNIHNKTEDLLDIVRELKREQLEDQRLAETREDVNKFLQNYHHNFQQQEEYTTEKKQNFLNRHSQNWANTDKSLLSILRDGETKYLKEEIAKMVEVQNLKEYTKKIIVGPEGLERQRRQFYDSFMPKNMKILNSPYCLLKHKIANKRIMDISANNSSYYNFNHF